MDINWFTKITPDAIAPKLTSEEIRLAVRELRKRNTKEDFDGCFHAWIHAEQEFDLLSDTTVLNIYNYSSMRGQNNPLIKGSVPIVYSVSFHRYTTIEDRPHVAKEDFVIETGTSLSDDKHLAIFKGF